MAKRKSYHTEMKDRRQSPYALCLQDAEDDYSEDSGIDSIYAESFMSQFPYDEVYPYFLNRC